MRLSVVGCTLVFLLSCRTTRESSSALSANVGDTSACKEAVEKAFQSEAQRIKTLIESFRLGMDKSKPAELRAVSMTIVAAILANQNFEQTYDQLKAENGGSENAADLLRSFEAANGSRFATKELQNTFKVKISELLKTSKNNAEVLSYFDLSTASSMDRVREYIADPAAAQKFADAAQAELKLTEILFLAAHDSKLAEFRSSAAACLLEAATVASKVQVLQPEAVRLAGLAMAEAYISNKSPELIHALLTAAALNVSNAKAQVTGVLGIADALKGLEAKSFELLQDSVKEGQVAETSKDLIANLRANLKTSVSESERVMLGQQPFDAQIAEMVKSSKNRAEIISKTIESGNKAIRELKLYEVRRSGERSELVRRGRRAGL